MKKIVLSLFVCLFVLAHTNVFACVGRSLTIGSLSSNHDKLLTQLVAVIINERTGTTVNVKFFKNSDELYQAVVDKEVNILTESTSRAGQRLKLELKGDADGVYQAVKKGYKEQLQLILLEPFGPSVGTDDKTAQDVPIVVTGILTNFPVLPRVVNKLAGIGKDKNYPKLLAAVEAGKDPAQVAKDFLRKKRFI